MQLLQALKNRPKYHKCIPSSVLIVYGMFVLGKKDAYFLSGQHKEWVKGPYWQWDRAQPAHTIHPKFVD